jgi:hypothetical protein
MVDKLRILSERVSTRVSLTLNETQVLVEVYSHRSEKCMKHLR